jgi:hypothetical protein
METHVTTSALKGLTFATVNAKPATVDPIMVRRNSTIKRLEDQTRLANDPNSARILHTRTGDKTQRVQPWFQQNHDGTYAFFVRCGWSHVKFDKGNAVTVASKEKLPAVIDTLIEAVRNGELDSQLQAASSEVAAKLKRKPLSKKK